MQKIAIIGAGVSGLTAAHQLNDRYAVKIYEKESRPGGLIKCERINGSLFHICGGHVFNSKRQDVLDWFWKLFKCDEEFTKTDRNSVVFMDKDESSMKYNAVPYPIENHMFCFSEDIQKSFIRDILNINRGG